MDAKEDDIFDQNQKILKLVTKCKEKEEIICSLKKLNSKFVSNFLNHTELYLHFIRYIFISEMLREKASLEKEVEELRALINIKRNDTLNKDIL